MALPWDELVKVVQENDRFVLTSHIRPDCDALGSELGMAGILETLGKEVTIINGHETPPNLAFIDPARRIKTLGVDLKLDEIPEHDVLVILDTSAWAQLGPMGEVVKTTPAHKIIVDHHVSADELGATPYKDPESEATGRLITELAGRLGVELTPEIATPLFAALATDTGWFRFGSVSAGTYQTAAKLMDGGADPTWVYAQLYEQETLGRTRLRGVILSRFRTLHDGRLAHTYVRKSDFLDTGAHPSDTEDAINQGLAVAETQVAAILVEQTSGGFKISFRSRCHVDCSKVAEQFGGGGHKAAAGAFIDEPFETAQAKVVKALGDALLAS